MASAFLALGAAAAPPGAPFRSRRLRSCSWPFSQRFEVAELLGGLVGDAARLVGTAHGEKVTPRTRARIRRRGKKAELDRAVDDLERLEADPAVRLVDRDLVVDEAAGRRAVEEPSRAAARLEGP